MKHVLTLSFVFIGCFCLAQNTSPTIEIISTSIDELAQQVTVVYALEDADNDLCEVWVKISEDDGLYF